MPKVIVAKAPDGNGVVLLGQSLDDILTAGTGDQTLNGNAGNDVVIGGAGNQFLYGGSGNDYVYAGVGNQTLDGGAGVDTLDFSHVTGRLSIDLDLHTASILDATTGAVVNTYAVTSFDTVVGTSTGNDFYAAAFTARTYVGGAGSDHYFSENGGDVVTGGGGADIFGWFRKYVAVGHTDEITDFQVGIDHLDLRDFLKGQTIKNNGHAATLVQGLAAGAWHDVAVLDGLVAHDLHLSDLLFV
jgi:large repetitive protein